MGGPVETLNWSSIQFESPFLWPSGPALPSAPKILLSTDFDNSWSTVWRATPPNYELVRAVSIIASIFSDGPRGDGGHPTFTEANKSSY